MLGLITDNLATIIIGLILLGIILLVVRSMRRDKKQGNPAAAAGAAAEGARAHRYVIRIKKSGKAERREDDVDTGGNHSGTA